MSTHFLFRGTLKEANAYAAGRRDLTVEDDPSEAWPRSWCAVRRRSAWIDLRAAIDELRLAKEATKLARRAYCFSSTTRRRMQRDARNRSECAIAYALRAQLHIKAGLLT
jgi:hypothetical protein